MPIGPPGPGSVPETTGRVRVAGIGDLVIVRQRIKRYDPGEVAHIENVLRGEAYTRNFRRKETAGRARALYQGVVVGDAD